MTKKARHTQAKVQDRFRRTADRDLLKVKSGNDAKLHIRIEKVKLVLVSLTPSFLAEHVSDAIELVGEDCRLTLQRTNGQETDR